MILEKQTEANVLVDGQAQESIGMSLDLDSAQILMQMLSKNLYSDDIGSAIRECASNALDSHRRAGVDEPIIVSFKASAANNYEFCVEDFGIGLDDEDVKNIISKYGKSTKRDSATELGMMGLGFKAPLAYSSSFYFVCRKNGMERKYMMYEGEDTNTIDLLYEKETTERNGVKIIIPVKYSDKWQFHKKIKEQLCYFESVYFDVPEDSSITNEFIISRHEHFQFSEMSTDDRLHICLDNVYYPLDFDKLGINMIDFPIALRFSLSDGLYPTPNRESLRYTQEAKKIIMQRLTDVADYFIGKYNETVEEGNDIKSVVNYLEKSGYYLTMENGDKQKIDPFVGFSTIKPAIPQLEGVKLLNFSGVYKVHKQSILQNSYKVKYSLRYKRMLDMEKHYTYGFNIQNVCNGDANVYIYEDRIPGIKKDYLRATCKESDYNFFVKAAKPMALGIPAKFDPNTYYHFLGLKNYPKEQWRQVISEYQHVISLLSADFINLDELEVPQHFIDSRKKVKVSVSGTGVPGVRRQKLKGEINGKEGDDLQKWSEGRCCKFVPTIYKLESLESDNNLKVYAHHDDYMKLDALFGCIQKQKMKVVTFSQRELNIVKNSEIHNLMSLEQFMEGKNKPFKRMVTAYLIKQMMDKYRSTFDRYVQVGYTCKAIQTRLEVLSKYAASNYYLPGYSGGSVAAKEFLDSMLAVAEEHKLFDMTIYPEVMEMQEIFDKLPFLNSFMYGVGFYQPDSPLVNVLADLFKYYKYKINLEHYNVKLNEEVITEETIEELVNNN
jgi:anti-sigma regulatory factor (Ser/Thr protein kinase)